MKRLWLWCLVVVTLLAGCGGGFRQGASSPGKTTPAPAASSFGGGAPGMSANAPEMDSDGATASLSPPPPAPPATTSTSEAPRSASREAPEPSPVPRERPGLGTEWGEQRFSRVHDVTFERADDNRPFAVATLHYNDHAGVEALAEYHASRGARLREASAAGGAITVAIHDGTGEPLEAVNVGDRTYVIGQAGERYTIVLTNHTGHRFEAVGTVDGLDVINGQTGTLQNRGYVLMPFATLEIEGFRQSQDAVAAFRFSKVSESYAAQVGKPRNVGVIGVAFFTEAGDAPVVWTQSELERRDTASPFPGTDTRFARPPRR
jgi:hypothetical protein